MSAAGYRSAPARCANGAGALAAWISSSQHLKPENLMPSFDMLPADELGAIAAYLASLQ